MIWFLFVTLLSLCGLKEFVVDGSTCGSGANTCGSNTIYVCTDGEDCSVICDSSNDCTQLNVTAPANGSLTVECSKNFACDGLSVNGQAFTTSITVSCTVSSACDKNGYGISIYGNGANNIYFNCDADTCGIGLYINALESKLLIVTIESTATTRVTDGTFVCPNDGFNKVSTGSDYPCQFYSNPTSTSLSNMIQVEAVEGFAKDFYGACGQSSNCFSSSSTLKCTTMPNDNYCVISQDAGTGAVQCGTTTGPNSCQTFTFYSTSAPTNQPSNDPTSMPSNNPSVVPTAQGEQPTYHPTPNTNAPSKNPSDLPSTMPSNNPTLRPTRRPTPKPTNNPSAMPSSNPTKMPSSNPTDRPTDNPTRYPSNNPTQIPVKPPTRMPNNAPSTSPTSKPSNVPSSMPTDRPSNEPSNFPTDYPSGEPSNSPTRYPTNLPSDTTNVPTESPTPLPANDPTYNPTYNPSLIPTQSPSDKPTSGSNSSVTSTTGDSSEQLWITIIIILSTLVGISLIIACCCGVYVYNLSKLEEYGEEGVNTKFSDRFSAAASDAPRRATVAVKRWIEGLTPATGTNEKKKQLEMVANEVPITTQITLSTDKNHTDGTPNENYKKQNTLASEGNKGNKGNNYKVVALPMTSSNNDNDNDNYNDNLETGDKQMYTAEEEDELKQAEYVTPGGPDVDDMDMKESEDASSTANDNDNNNDNNNDNDYNSDYNNSYNQNALSSSIGNNPNFFNPNANNSFLADYHSPNDSSGAPEAFSNLSAQSPHDQLHIKNNGSSHMIPSMSASNLSHPLPAASPKMHANNISEDDDARLAFQLSQAEIYKAIQAQAQAQARHSGKQLHKRDSRPL